MVDNNILITIIREDLEVDSTLFSLADIKILFQRALNTWSDIPPELLEFSDKLEKL
jgi:hypothetical protein